MSSEQNETSEALSSILSLSLALMGRQQAYEILTTTMLSTILNKSPELIDEMEEDFKNVAELHRKMTTLPEQALRTYDEHIELLRQKFDLVRMFPNP
jgi:hypothetical protein